MVPKLQYNSSQEGTPNCKEKRRLDRKEENKEARKQRRAYLTADVFANVATKSLLDPDKWQRGFTLNPTKPYQ